jgi:hypothetical protein
MWFRKEKERVTGNVGYIYQGKYWDCKDKQDWTMCPDIY